MRSVSEREEGPVQIFARARRAAFVCLLIAVDSLCVLVPKRRRRIALVVRLDAVGDFIIWTQYGASEISRFARGSGRKVMLIANRAWAAYAETTGLWDAVLEVDPARLVQHPWYRMRALLRIRRLGAELMIQPRAARFFLLEDCIARTCGAQARIGNAGTLLNLKPWQQRVGNGFYSRVIQVEEDDSAHALHRHSQFASALTGQTTERWKLPRPLSSSPTGAVVVALGAGDVGRAWPVEKLATVIRHVVKNHPGVPVRLYGLAADIETSRRLQILVGTRLDNMVGRTPLRDFVGAIADARLIICNESSAYHIAMAYDTPVLCFLGGGHYGQFAPYPHTGTSPGRAAVLSVAMACFGCNWKCIYERGRADAYRCVGSISEDSALTEVDRLLAADRRSIPPARQPNEGV